MAQKGADLDQETFCCSICLDLLKDPVTIPCGHSYCMKCLQGFWDEEDKIHSCPQCRKTFTPRPAVVKNTMLADLVDQLKKTGLQAAPAGLCHAGPEDVSCDVCSGRKLKAIKSCLTCLSSYCETHLQPHWDTAPLKKHKLVEPSKNLQGNICCLHDEVMKMFCRTDQKCICYLCSVEEHRGHDTVSAAAERTERQRELEESQHQIQQRIQDREKELKLLQQQLEAVNETVDHTVDDSDDIFAEIIQLIQKRKAEVENKIRSQQQTEVSRVKDVLEQLQQEISELKRRDAELKQLSLTEDHQQFLLSYPSLPPLRESSSVKVSLPGSRVDVTAAVSELQKKLHDILKEELTNISTKVSRVDVSLSEPKSRANFLKYFRRITLDPDTAHPRLMMLKSKKVTGIARHLSYPENPDRFTFWWQVLSKESLTGRSYWEVDWKAEGLYIAVAYKSISRDGSGQVCRFGWNDKSWALHIYGNNCSFYHNCEKVSISAAVSSRVGVYVDHRAGVLAFYSVSESMSLLHRVQTTFTQPLHAGLWLSLTGDSAEFMHGAV